MPLPNPEKDKHNREKEAYRRGKHDRRKGKDFQSNPFVRSDLDHEPDLYENWVAGWKVMQSQIESGNIEEYD
jgi:hypothetical protein